MKLVLSVVISLIMVAVPINLVVSDVSCSGVHVILTSAPKPQPITGMVDIMSSAGLSTTFDLTQTKITGNAVHFMSTPPFTQAGFYTVTAGMVGSYTLKNVPYEMQLNCTTTAINLAGLSASSNAQTSIFGALFGLIVIVLFGAIVILTLRSNKND
jgi:hypothetical protein